jgi:hypothetical protein
MGSEREEDIVRALRRRDRERGEAWDSLCRYQAIGVGCGCLILTLLGGAVVWGLAAFVRYSLPG